MSAITAATGTKRFPALMKVSAVCEEISLSRSATYQLIQAGRLEHVKIGKSIRIPGDSLAKFLESLRDER